MSTFSCWNWSTKKYDLYEAPGEELGQRPAPRRVGPGANGNGQQLESLLVVLPRSAKQVGESEFAQGRVAVHYSSPAATAGFGDFAGLGAGSWLLVVGFVYFAWRTLGKR